LSTPSCISFHESIVPHVFFFISGELHHGCSFFIRFLATTDQGRDLLGRRTLAAISRPFAAPSRAPRDALQGSSAAAVGGRSATAAGA
jgi:hypothetical protein